MSLRSGNSSAMTRGDSSKLAIIEDRNPQAYSKERFYQSDQGRPMAPFVSRRPRAGQREGSSPGCVEPLIATHSRVSLFQHQLFRSKSAWSRTESGAGALDPHT
jgi:hypothetical protein